MSQREFQSPPGPKAGRYGLWPMTLASLTVFQSPPGPKAGRYLAQSAPATLEGPCFNPRPARKPGATLIASIDAHGLLSFQSPPGPKAGRYPV